MSLAYFPLYPDDFEAATAHLSMAEDGAYNRLLRLCWRMPGCTIPADRQWVYRRLRAHTTDDRALVELVLSEFFTEANGRLSNARLLREFEKAQECHNRRKEAGSKGGRKKTEQKQANEPSNALAMQEQCSSNQNHNQNHNHIEDTDVSSPPLPPTPKSKGTRLPPDWMPSEDDIQAARNITLTEQEISRERDNFRDFWISKAGSGATKLDWSATWRVWCRRVVASRRGPQAGNATGRGHGQQPRSIAAAAMQRHSQAEGPRDDWRAGSIDVSSSAGGDGLGLRVIDGGAGIPDQRRPSDW